MSTLCDLNFKAILSISFSSSFLYRELQALPLLILSTRPVDLWCLWSDDGHFNGSQSEVVLLNLVFSAYNWSKKFALQSSVFRPFLSFCYLDKETHLLVHIECPKQTVFNKSWFLDTLSFCFCRRKKLFPSGSLQTNTNKKVNLKCLSFQLEFLKDNWRNLFHLRSAPCLYACEGWPQHLAKDSHSHYLLAAGQGENKSENTVGQNIGKEII